MRSGASIQFPPSLGVPRGGVLCPLPALLENRLLAVLREEIVPRLLEEVPGQPPEEGDGENALSGG